jgi:hypothetical protein
VASRFNLGDSKERDFEMKSELCVLVKCGGSDVQSNIKGEESGRLGRKAERLGISCSI